MLPKEEPQLNTTDIDPEDNPYIMEVSEDMATDAEEELIDEPSQLLPYEDIDAFSVAEVDAEVRQADEHFISRLIETTEALPPVVEFTPEPVIEEEPLPVRKRRKLFARKGDAAEAYDKHEMGWGLTPIGAHRNDDAAALQADLIDVEVSTAGVTDSEEDAREYKSSAVDEFPEVKAVAETITMPVVLPSGAALPRGEEHTRILPTAEAEDAPAAAAPAPAPVIVLDDQLPDQLSLEEMVRVEDMEPSDDIPAVDDAEDPEERLQRSREEKIREFTLGGDEEEENEPEEEPVEEAEPEIEDFTSYQDVQTVADELK